MSAADGELTEPPEVGHLGGVPTAIMTNAQYKSAVDQKVKDLKKAALDLVDEMHHRNAAFDFFSKSLVKSPWVKDESIGPDWLSGNTEQYAAGTDRDDLEDVLDVPVEKWRTELLHFTAADLDEAVRMDRHWYNEVKRFTAFTNGGQFKGTTIKESLKSWDGPKGSAAEKFRQYYCSEINEMIQYQAMTTNAFRMIMQAQAALIAYSRYRALSIADDALKAMNAELRAEETENQEEMRNFAIQLGTTIAASGSGGAAVLAAGGAAVVNQLPNDKDRAITSEIVGEEAWDITASMMKQLVGIRGDIKRRSGGLQNALKELEPLLTGQDAEKLLPVKVNL